MGVLKIVYVKVAKGLLTLSFSDLPDKSIMYYLLCMRLQVRLWYFGCGFGQSCMEWIVQSVYLNKSTLSESIIHIANLIITEFWQLSDTKWLKKKKLVLPIQLLSKGATKGTFRFRSPKAVTLVGSYRLGVCNRPDVRVDLAVEMPQVRRWYRPILYK